MFSEQLPTLAHIVLPENLLRPIPIEPKEDDILHAHCHCNGVSFYITRPNDASLDISSNFPDLLVPYHSHWGDDIKNPDNEPWWLSEDQQRYKAGNCACRSCRKASGFELQQWAFIPRANVKLPAPSSSYHHHTSNSSSSPSPSAASRPTLQDFTLPFGTLTGYHSSGGVTRYFCGRCGANALWTKKGSRAELLDVSVGLLDAESGARAEEWLEWVTTRVSFAEEAGNKELVEIVEKGLKSWGYEVLRSREERK